MNNLETAQALFENLMYKVKEHRELGIYYRNWRRKNKNKSIWEEENREARDMLEKYYRYYPTQLENQIIIIRRMLNEGKKELWEG
jgi:hypothetical protein